MKKTILISIIAAIALAVAAIYFFFFSTSEAELLSKVPSGAKSVLIIDIKGLSTKLVIDELSSDEKSTDKVVEMLPDSLIEIDWDNSGINLLDKAVLFTNEKDSSIQLNLLMQISDYQKFEVFVDSLATSDDFIKEKQKKAAFLIIEKYNLIASWNRNFVLISNFSKNPEDKKKELSNILTLKKQESIITDSIFNSKLSSDYDLFLYSLPYSGFPKENLLSISNNVSVSYSFIHLNDGELEIETEIVLKEGSLLENIFASEQNASIKTIEKTDSIGLSVLLNLNSKALFRAIEQYSQLKLNIDKVPLLNAWNGSAHLVFNPSKTIQTEFISYEYDDDFNKVEVKKYVSEKVSDIQSNIGYNQIVLDSLLSHNRIFKSGKDTLLFKGSSFMVKNVGESYQTFNKNITPNAISKETNESQLAVEINYRNFLLNLDDFGIETDSLWSNRFDIEKIELSVNKKQSLEATARFYFMNKDKNALFSILEKLKDK